VPEPVRLHLAGFDRHGTTRARLGRRWIEVEHGIPGETVEAEVRGNRRRPIGQIVSVLDPSPVRVDPPCPYFREWTCGGCQWQQIDYAGQLEFKRQSVEAAMVDAGIDAPIAAIHALSDPWRYRSTAGIALGKHAGFRRHGSQAIVPIHDCPISHPRIGQLMADLNRALDEGSIPNYHGRLRLDVRVAGSSPEWVLQCFLRSTRDGDSVGPDAAPLIELLAGMTDVGLMVSRGGEIEVITGELLSPVEVAGRTVYLAAASFFQTNLSLLPELISRLREEAGTGSRIADVYGGVGLFGLFLGDEANEVVVIESDPLAVLAGKRTAEAWGWDNIRFVVQPAEEALATEGCFDIIVVDPPRTGLNEPVLNQLTASPSQKILYVSCLAESLARDLRILLDSGYQLTSLELFDFYPQTYHVELLAVLQRGNSSLRSEGDS